MWDNVFGLIEGTYFLNPMLEFFPSYKKNGTTLYPASHG